MSDEDTSTNMNHCDWGWGSCKPYHALDVKDVIEAYKAGCDLTMFQAIYPDYQEIVDAYETNRQLDGVITKISSNDVMSYKS